MVIKLTAKQKKSGILQVLPQIPGTREDWFKDKSRTALAPGKRISKNNNIYYEQRENRSDVTGKKNDFPDKRKK